MNKKQIGEAITKERTLQQLTQVQLAEKLDVRRQSVIEIELAQFDYRIDRLLATLDALDLQVLIVKKDASVAMMTASPVGSCTDVMVFRGVKPLLEEIPKPKVKKKTKKK